MRGCVYSVALGRPYQYIWPWKLIMRAQTTVIPFHEVDGSPGKIQIAA
jgi:hypothetical protein